jgi:hypothetical protein
MRREDKKKIIQKRRQIVNHLIDLEGVLDYLITKQVFSPAIRERILYVNNFFDILVYFRLFID